MTLNGKKYDRFVKEAQACFDGFGIDFDQYLSAVPIFHPNEGTWEVTWEHRTSKRVIVLTDVHADYRGRILQFGTMSGRLTL